MDKQLIIEHFVLITFMLSRGYVVDTVSRASPEFVHFVRFFDD